MNENFGNKDYPLKGNPLSVKRIPLNTENELLKNVINKIRSETNFEVRKEFFDIWNDFLTQEEISKNSQKELSSEEKSVIFYKKAFPEIVDKLETNIDNIPWEKLAQAVEKRASGFLSESPNWKKLSTYYIYDRLSFTMPEILLSLSDHLSKEQNKFQFLQKKGADWKKYIQNKSMPEMNIANVAIDHATDQNINSLNFNFTLEGNNEEGSNVVLNNEVAKDLQGDLKNLNQEDLQKIAELFYKDFCQRIKMHINLYEKQDQETKNIELVNFVVKEDFSEQEKYDRIQGLITEYQQDENEFEAKLTSIGLGDVCNLLNQSGPFNEMRKDMKVLYDRLKKVFLCKLIIFGLMFEEEKKK